MVRILMLVAHEAPPLLGYHSCWYEADGFVRGTLRFGLKSLPRPSWDWGPFSGPSGFRRWLVLFLRVRCCYPDIFFSCPRLRLLSEISFLCIVVYYISICNGNAPIAIMRIQNKGIQTASITESTRMPHSHSDPSHAHATVIHVTVSLFPSLRCLIPGQVCEPALVSLGALCVYV